MLAASIRANARYADDQHAGNGVSTTLEGPLDRPDASVARGDAVDVIARLKDESQVPLRSHGSLSMNRALTAAGLADRVQLTLFPVITGQTGLDPLFQGAADFDLELVETRTLDGDIQELVYRPTCTPDNCGLERELPAGAAEASHRRRVAAGGRLHSAAQLAVRAAGVGAGSHDHGDHCGPGDQCGGDDDQGHSAWPPSRRSRVLVPVSASLSPDMSKSRQVADAKRAPWRDVRHGARGTCDVDLSGALRDALEHVVEVSGERVDVEVTRRVLA